MKIRVRHETWQIFVLVGVLLVIQNAKAADLAVVNKLKITILSTMLADGETLGEWGFSALVEVDGQKILFDTGLRPDTVLQNATSMKLDLSEIEDVVLSHNHADHTGGLIKLRTELKSKNPHALVRAHVAPQIFWPRLENGKALTSMQDAKTGYERQGGHFEVHNAAFEIVSGVWFTGPIPRKYSEFNYPPGVRVENAEGVESEDNLPEDSALVFNTKSGLVLLSGCGHAGIVNTATYVRKLLGPSPIAALIGGFHLFLKDDTHLEWTSARLREFHVGALLGAHCTGIEAVYQLRKHLGLTRRTAIVAAVGSSYTLGTGLDAGGFGLAR